MDETTMKISERTMLMNKLKTQDEKNFFNYGYITSRNKHIISRLTPRGAEEFIDSLFNDLVRLQLSDPFAEELIPLIGYPIWGQAIVHPQVEN